MLLTDESGAANQMVSYTAFGELVRPSGTIGYDPNAALPTRYQYAGGWGYESGVISLYGANPNLPPITLMHVGARWYQPEIGRFVQRDPIGTWGGLNAYAYCRANPLCWVDALGLAASGPEWPGEVFFNHPATKGSGVVLTVAGILGTGVVARTAPASIPAICIVTGVTALGTALWGGSDAYAGAHWIADHAWDIVLWPLGDPMSPSEWRDDDAVIMP